MNDEKQPELQTIKGQKFGPSSKDSVFYDF